MTPSVVQLQIRALVQNSNASRDFDVYKKNSSLRSKTDQFNGTVHKVDLGRGSNACRCATLARALCSVQRGSDDTVGHCRASNICTCVFQLSTVSSCKGMQGHASSHFRSLIDCNDGDSRHVHHALPLVTLLSTALECSCAWVVITSGHDLTTIVVRIECDLCFQLPTDPHMYD